MSNWTRSIFATCFLLLTINTALPSQNGDADKLFDWAEVEYSELFAPAGETSTTDTSGEWYYRYYPGTQSYVGVNLDGDVWVAGSPFGEAAYINTLTSLLDSIPVTEPNIGFSIISDSDWSETAVRKVLHTFAYGGHSTDQQISLWANMNPSDAIQEMLTFEPSNLKLSPSPTDALRRKTAGTLQSLSNFWSSNDPENEVPQGFRENYIIKNFYTSDCHEANYYHGGNFTYTWIHAVLAKGSNPFLHKIGFWETNYHMVANDAVDALSFWHLMRHYDNITSNLIADRPYHEVLANGALSMAIGLQYGHINDYWINGYGGQNGNYIVDNTFHGNEDFGREFHQLFFGVLGEMNHDYHETVTIRNTAKALSDMRHYNQNISAECDYNNVRGWPSASIQSSEFHSPDPTEMYHQIITGNTAEDKINALAKITIEQEESLDNLPILIISGLADDNLTPEKTDTIQEAWRQIQPKNLLSFLRSYAVSPTFHSADRIKYYSTFDRNLILYNKLDIQNSELHRVTNEQEGGRWSLPQDILWGAFSAENVQPFRPLHDVFGHQKGREAINTPGILKSVYNRSTESWRLNFTVIRDPTNWQNIVWSKDMTRVINPEPNGLYTVKHVAEILWNRLVADGLKNFGTLERAHIYALLANSGNDLGMKFKDAGLINDENYAFSSQELENTPLFTNEITTLGNSTIALNSADLTERTKANEKVNLAIAFIGATPYMFMQEGL